MGIHENEYWLTYDDLARICGVSRDEVEAMFGAEQWRSLTGSLATPPPLAEAPLYLTSATEWRIKEPRVGEEDPA